MASADGDQGETYVVVVNREEQYSIWREDEPIPPGWRVVGTAGPRSHCLRYIDEIWTDMRPASLRKDTDERARPA